MTVASLKIKVQNLFNFQNPNLIFMHVPKTGGTSVDRTLREIYGKNKSYKVDSVLTTKAVKAVNQKDISIGINKFQIRQSLLLCEMAKGTPYISGHFHFSQEIWEAYRHQYNWITILRDPVKRYISQYFYDAYKPSEHARVNESLEDFIESNRGQLRGQNYINYFGNFSRADNSDFQTRLEVAKENLAKFSLIAFLDDLESFQKELNEKFNLTVTIPHMNKSPVAKPQIDDSVKQTIAKICEYDLKFYSYAKEKFSSAIL